MQLFVLNYARPVEQSEVSAPYSYDCGLQLNVLPGGRYRRS